MKNREIAEWLRQQANALHMPALMLEDGIEYPMLTLTSMQDALSAINEMQKTLEDRAKELEADDEDDEDRRPLNKRERKNCKALAENLILAFPWGAAEYPDTSNIHGSADKWACLYKHLANLGEENE